MSAYPVLMHTAIDATDCRSLAEFYRQFLGLRYRPGDLTDFDRLCACRSYMPGGGRSRFPLTDHGGDGRGVCRLRVDA